ncbi:MAG: hypothetical protein AB1Z98_15220 [Nannocystaceae bacterium]
MVVEGDAAYANGQLEVAISKYRASYYGLSPEDQASYLGSLPVRKAMRAYEQLIASEPDPERQRALRLRLRLLVVEFLDAIAGKEGVAEEVGEDVITELEEKRSSIDEALAEPMAEDSDAPNPPASLVDEPTVDEVPEERGSGDEQDQQHLPSLPAPGPKLDWLGIGLVLGGSTALMAGGGVSIGYFNIRADADAQVAASDDPDSDDAQGYLQRQYAKARKFLIAGSVVGGVGIAVVVGGVVRLALHRRHARRDATASTLAPLLTPTAAGLTLQRRF